MGFSEAISVCFAKYATFDGRAARPEYWYFVLLLFLVSAAASLIDAAVGSSVGVIEGLWHLATIVPSIAVTARRLHDTDRSGWWQLLAFIPIVGWIILIVWMATAGTPGPNRFGPPPGQVYG